MSPTLRLAALAVGVVLAVSPCTGSTAPRGAPVTSTAAPTVLNGLSATDILAAINSAGLPIPHIHDVTAQICAKLHCAGAVDSDTVSILTFDRSRPAQLYAGAISNSYQLENVVLVFAATVTAGQKAAYEGVVEHAVAGVLPAGKRGSLGGPQNRRPLRAATVTSPRDQAYRGFIDAITSSIGVPPRGVSIHQ